MGFNYYIQFFIFTLIICAPPPTLDPIYEPYVYPSTLVKNEDKTSSFSYLKETPAKYIDKEKGVNENSYKSQYKFGINNIEEQTLKLKSNSFHKIKTSGEEGTNNNKNKYIPSFSIKDN